MQRLIAIHCQIVKNDTFRKGEARSETMLAQHYPNHSVVQFNRSRYMNSMNVNMIFWINRFVDFWNANPNIKVCIWKGDGVSFCTGGDLVLWRESIERRDYESADFMHTFTYKSMARVKNMNPIQISIWDGFVMGGGVGVSINAKIRIATDSTVFAMPEVGVGYFPDFASTIYFSKLRSNLGLYYALTGAKINGKQLFAVGLADYFVPQSRLEELEKVFAEEIDENITLEKLKKIVEKFNDPQKEPIEHEELIKEVFSGKTLAEIFTKLEELSKNDEFAQKILHKLQKSPPRSLRIAFEQCKRAKNMDVNQGLEMDYGLTRLMQEHDFLEGVGVLFLRKEKRPEWQDKSIDIPDETINKYFKPTTDPFRKIDFANIK